MQTPRLHHLLSLFSKKMIKNWSQARISPRGFAWQTGLKMPWEMREVLYKLQMLRPTAIICISAYVRHYSYWLFSYYCYRLSYHQSRCHHVVVLQVHAAHVIYFIHHTCTYMQSWHDIIMVMLVKMHIAVYECDCVWCMQHLSSVNQCVPSLSLGCPKCSDDLVDEWR